MCSIMNKKVLALLLLITGLCFNSFSQVNDAALWTSVNIEKKINNRLTANLSQEFRFKENISELGTAFTEIGVEHKIIKRLSASISYRFIQNRRNNDTYSLRHRMNIDVAYRIKWKKLNITIRERWQNQVKDVQSSPEGFDPESYLRSKLTFKYNLEKKYTPWIAGELFYQLNNSKGNEIDNLRYSMGVDYKFNKKNSLTLFYLINQEVNVNDPWTSYVIGVNYSYSF